MSRPRKRLYKSKGRDEPPPVRELPPPPEPDKRTCEAAGPLNSEDPEDGDEDYDDCDSSD